MASLATERRTRRNRTIVDQHPQWRGIRHPQRIMFQRSLDEATARRMYHAAVLRALEHLRQSETLCSSIDAVAGRLEHRAWGWSTNPAAATPPRPPAAPPRERVARAWPRRGVARTLVHA